jgi:hypothetical protein
MDKYFQKIEVGAHKEIGGQWEPDRFIWQGTNYKILEIGRRWQDEDGQHILVMVLGGQVYELILDIDQISWYLKPPTMPRVA